MFCPGFCPYTYFGPWGGVKRSKHFFLKIVMLHIKLKGMERRRAPCKHIFCPYTHPRPVGWGQKFKTFFSECGHVAYQIKEKEVWTSMQAKTLTLHTPDLWVGLKGQIMKLNIELSTKIVDRLLITQCELRG